MHRLALAFLTPPLKRTAIPDPNLLVLEERLRHRLRRSSTDHCENGLPDIRGSSRSFWMFENISNVLGASQTVFHRPRLRRSPVSSRNIWNFWKFENVLEDLRMFWMFSNGCSRIFSKSALLVAPGASPHHTFIEFRLQLCFTLILQFRPHEEQQGCRVLDSP